MEILPDKKITLSDYTSKKNITLIKSSWKSIVISAICDNFNVRSIFSIYKPNNVILVGKREDVMISEEIFKYTLDCVENIDVIKKRVQYEKRKEGIKVTNIKINKLINNLTELYQQFKILNLKSEK